VLGLRGAPVSPLGWVTIPADIGLMFQHTVLPLHEYTIDLIDFTSILQNNNNISSNKSGKAYHETQLHHTYGR
jgi:hypothetical protein